MRYDNIIINGGGSAQHAVITTGGNTSEVAWILHGERVNGVQSNTAVFSNSESLSEKLLWRWLENEYEKQIPY